MNYSGMSIAAETRASRDQIESDPLTPRQRARLERDQARGYSINTKQIVLAFAVEFVIIGLILTNNAATVAQLPDTSLFKMIQAMLFPIAMAMVELARVPLAVAVRTQTSWNIKLAALVGVLCAVAVTSVSLILIGNSTFNPRLEDTSKKSTILVGLQQRKQEILLRVKAADELVRERRNERDAAERDRQNLNLQLNAQPRPPCVVVTRPASTPGGPPETRSVCPENPVLKPLQAEIASLKVKLVDLEAALKAAETQRASPTLDTGPIDKEIEEAEKDSRGSVQQSQLHAYAAMLFRKAPADITEADVKTLELYLIVIPSIAAAFSSTLIAMTAVRRIKPTSTSEGMISDEAAAYLFGPLVAAIRSEAREAVKSAMKSSQLA
ncbi:MULTISPECIES: hypothetical protein [unclassified Bradyrhizobium]|uniref:hypothetical protein n=1 Tax=unclassified Bradyrhizobium TaxID=2631580 RepID=UPI0028E56C97|nr:MULTISPECIES: hypothetical protein [unclassified Bradyrhizobium]